ncbi:MAG: amino acid--tRNA ligase-related protein [Candidatus Micrarchaeota archaeon]
MKEVISTLRGDYSKEKFGALASIRQTALDGLREALKERGYTEVTVASLVNIAGSCENPHASFSLNYYGREAHLSQSAQLQLEALVLRLRKGFFTVNNSFREENYKDPEAGGRRLSEFTLVEPEKPYEGLFPEEALDKIVEEETTVMKHATQKVLENNLEDVELLGGDNEYLKNVVKEPFERLTYEEALKLLNGKGGHHKFGDDLGVKEERAVLRHFDNIPTFVTHYPSSIKFFNMKRTPCGKKVYSVDLLMPKLGETVGGAVREENGKNIERQFRESKIGEYLSAKKMDVAAPFAEYFALFEQEAPLLRGGYGIGFERFVGFLIGSNDILETIAYRTLRPV